MGFARTREREFGGSHSAPRPGCECILRKGEGLPGFPTVSRRVRVRRASGAREGVRGLPQHEQGTRVSFLIRCA